MIVYRQHNFSKQSGTISRSKLEAKKVDRVLESVNDIDKSTTNEYSEQKNKSQKGKLYENFSKKPFPKDEVNSEKSRIKKKNADEEEEEEEEEEEAESGTFELEFDWKGQTRSNSFYTRLGN